MSPFAENKSGCQGPVLFHEIDTTKQQTFIHMAAFMSNGTQTVVREPFHRISVIEKSSERSGYIQFCNEARLRIVLDEGSILSKSKEFS